MSRVAVITGGASGIGRAIAAELVRNGATAVLADIDGDAAEVVAKELTAAGPGTARGVRLDVRDGAAVGDVFRAARDEHGRLDFVFNNAGVAIGGLVEELTPEHWDRAIDVNLRGVVHGVHAAWPIMLAQGHGHIVNTASLAGLVAPAVMTPYTTTKHAVVGLSLALRAEGASRGIKVSALCPGFVDTPLLGNVNPGLPATHGSVEFKGRAKRLQPVILTPEKLARDVVRGMARNDALIIAPRQARVVAWLVRHMPAIGQLGNRQQVGRYLAEMRKAGRA